MDAATRLCAWKETGLGGDEYFSAAAPCLLSRVSENHRERCVQAMYVFSNGLVSRLLSRDSFSSDRSFGFKSSAWNYYTVGRKVQSQYFYRSVAKCNNPPFYGDLLK